MSELFGISEFFTFDCVQRIKAVLCLASRKYIKCPKQEEIINIEREIYNISGFSGVIGTVDGCHININAPGTVPADSFDKTMKHCVILMADKNSHIFKQDFLVYSMHGRRVFKSTFLCDKMENNPRQ